MGRQKLAAFIFGVVVLSAASTAQAGKLGTSTGQVEGTPSVKRGGRVTLIAGLAQSNGSVNYWSALPGPIDFFVAKGSRWIFVGRANASGFYGGPNTYARAALSDAVPKNASTGYQRIRVVYPGDNL